MKNRHGSMIARVMLVLGLPLLAGWLPVQAPSRTRTPIVSRLIMTNPDGVGVSHVTVDGKVYEVIGTGSDSGSDPSHGSHLILLNPGGVGVSHVTVDGKTYEVIGTGSTRLLSRSRGSRLMLIDTGLQGVRPVTIHGVDYSVIG